MTILDRKIDITDATNVSVDAAFLSVELSDGRTITAPLAWYPRLLHATAKERAGWTLIGHGAGIRWSDLDEDISVAGLIAGERSAESSVSLARWLDRRAKRASSQP